MNITIFGAGHVGMANALLLARDNHITIVDTDREKVDMINHAQSPVAERDIECALLKYSANIFAANDTQSAIKTADYIVICTPTDYDSDKNSFDTSSVENVICSAQQIKPEAAIVIRSTVPVGFTRLISEKYPQSIILFSPEFLREGKALYDNLNPSRIIVGMAKSDNKSQNAAKRFAELLLNAAESDSVPVMLLDSAEAESIKLFSNTYLALRIAFFNELDSYAESRGLNTKNIIEGVGFDPRIGSFYNNPSFGYGGYCLPKDTKQLLANFDHIPNNIIKAIVEANSTRKTFIAERVARLAQNAEQPCVIGVYRLTAKNEADNFRQSSVLDVIELLKAKGLDIVIYEPTLSCFEYCGCRIENDFSVFSQICGIILANRCSEQLKPVADKVYTRDIYMRD